MYSTGRSSNLSESEPTKCTLNPVFSGIFLSSEAFWNIFTLFYGIFRAFPVFSCLLLSFAVSKGLLRFFRHLSDFVRLVPPLTWICPAYPDCLEFPDLSMLVRLGRNNPNLFEILLIVRIVRHCLTCPNYLDLLPIVCIVSHCSHCQRLPRLSNINEFINSCPFLSVLVQGNDRLPPPQLCSMQSPSSNLEGQGR